MDTDFAHATNNSDFSYLTKVWNDVVLCFSALQVLESNGITLAELRCMSDAHLAQLGLPFGQRVRILKEVEQLLPLDGSDII